MNSSLVHAARVIAGFVAGGLGLNRHATPALSGQDRPAINEQAPREGLVTFALGGFHVLAADIAWLQMWSYWERRDWPAAESRIRLACALQPGALHFWLNGARIIAYDAPARPSARRVQAEAALEFLEGAEPFHHRDPRLWIERAGLELYGRRDLAAAAHYYRQAATLPNCPAFAGRLCAELLRRLGRRTEALAWLVAWTPSLRAADAVVARERIRELEQELGVAPEKAIQLPGNP